MLHLHLTRDSVAAGDDIDAPHVRHLHIKDVATAIDVVNAVIQQGYLPRVSGGMATWIVASREPFAVCAQEWAAPKAIGLPRPADWLVADGHELRLHFSYAAQFDPDLVFEVLSRCTFNAASV